MVTVKKPLSAKERVYRLVEPVSNQSGLEQFVDYFLLAMIAVSVFTFIIGTVPSVNEQYGDLINVIEIFAVAVFTIEYILRLWVCTLREEYSDPVWGRIRYALSPMMLIDLLAILPFYLTVIGGELLVLRILRLFRLVRILKVNRYSSAMDAVRDAWRKKGPELVIAASMMATLIIITGTLLYYAEQGHHDGERFTSIPDALWAAVAVVSPLGYDGYFPNTTIGKMLMMLIAVFGVAFVALPAGIFAGAFSSQISEIAHRDDVVEPEPAQVSAEIKCPHCGVPISMHPASNPQN